ncbi:hypothetical protein IKD98_03200 [Candidatus Saccharibacteria bacterium]|nr:hypothetical protein [Candidatus Saccharibacteria bacterium]
MPSWNIHLEAGERLAKKLKLPTPKRSEFLLGCLLPDINNGYINKVGIEKSHEETHYTFNNKSSLNFYADYQKEIDEKEPLFLGYLFHLYTDGYFNYDFYRKIKRAKIGQGLTREEKREIKHHDFWIYDTNFHHRLNLKDKTETRRLAKLANQIASTEITAEDLEDVERIMTDKKFHLAMQGEPYLFYSKKDLDQLLDDMIQSFSKDYLGAKHA